MTSEQYRARTLEVERYCQRLSFICDRECPAGDFFGHAEIVMRYLSDMIDADYYGVERPAIVTGVEHLDVDVARHLDHFDVRWRPDG